MSEIVRVDYTLNWTEVKRSNLFTFSLSDDQWTFYQVASLIESESIDVCKAGEDEKLIVHIGKFLGD